MNNVKILLEFFSLELSSVYYKLFDGSSSYTKRDIFPLYQLKSFHTHDIHDEVVLYNHRVFFNSRNYDKSKPLIKSPKDLRLFYIYGYDEINQLIYYKDVLRNVVYNHAILINELDVDKCSVEFFGD